MHDFEVKVAMMQGNLTKMEVHFQHPVQYFLNLKDYKKDNEEQKCWEIPLNTYIGQTIRLEFTGVINCTCCQRKIKKTYSDGYCYPCFQKLAECDLCVLKPELCHYDRGTCRDPKWGEAHCMRSHFVYLANSSGIKVGITRSDQIPIRWIDQGAVQGLVLFRVKTRFQSGIIENFMRGFVSDKTNWQKMLKNEMVEIDLLQVREELAQRWDEPLQMFKEKFGEEAIEMMNWSEITTITYPVLEYPKKITSLNLKFEGDKNEILEGTLLGIKGQYLIFDKGVFNVRKHTGYHLVLNA